MSNKVNVEISANVQGFVQGIDQATDSVKAYETETRKIKDENANLRKELASARREVQNLALSYSKLTQEEKNSQFGKELARQLEEAKSKTSELIDLNSDLQQELKNMASDTRVFDTLSESISIVGDTTSAAVGIIAQFTGKEDAAKKAVVAFTTAQSLANSAIKIGNALQPYSNTMKTIGAVKDLAAAAAIKIKTAAEGKGIITTKAATVAQAAFNKVALANPYVLLAAAIAGVTLALTSFIMFSDDASKVEEKQADAAETAAKAQEDYRKELEQVANNTISPLYSGFLKLQAIWNKLNTEAEKKKFIKDYANEMKQLGVVINSVTDAENLFVKNQDAFIDSIILRAKAAVLLKQIQDQLAHTDISLSNDKNAPNGKYKIGEGIARDLAKQYADVTMQIDKIMSQFKSKTIKTTSTVKSSAKKEIDTYAEAISQYDALIKKRDDLIKQMNEGRVDAQFFPDVEKEVDKLDKAAKAIGDKWHIKAKIELEPIQNSDISDIQKMVEEVLNPFTSGTAKYDFSKLPEEFGKSAELVISQMQKIEQQRNSLNEKMQNETSDVRIAAMQDAIVQLENEYDNLESKADVYQELADAAKILEDENKKLETSFNLAGDALANLGSIFKSVGDIADNKTFNIAGIIAQAVAQYILGWTEATAQAAKLGPIGWLGFGLSTAAQMFAMVAQIKQAGKYAEGGIVGGHSYTGDKLMAFVNSNEAILNTKQQQRVLDAVDDNKLLAVTSNKVEVVGRIRGTDILLVSKNTNKVLGMSGNSISI